MSGGEGGDGIVQKLHEAVPPALVGELQDFMFDRFLGLVEPLMEKKLGPKSQRMMSCGPYSGDGKIVIEDVASKAAQIGFTGMTIGSYYSPDDPKTRHPLSEVIPQFLSTMKHFPAHVYLRHFPRLASKAVFLENDERAQADELRGCYHYGIPTMGYIITPVVYHQDLHNSTFLKLMEGYSECKAPNAQWCGHMRDKQFCPFYDSISVPWASLELFLSKKSTIVAVESLDKLVNPLTMFLKHGVDKPKMTV